MPTPEIINNLLKRFENNIESYRSSGYNETQLRREFLDPFFDAFDWERRHINPRALKEKMNKFTIQGLARNHIAKIGIIS